MTDPLTRHAQALALLDRLDAEEREATIAPWEVLGGRIEGVKGGDVTPARVDCMSYCYGGVPESMEPADAALIVATRNAWPTVLTQARRALTQHSPDPDPIELMLHYDEDCPTGECVEGNGHPSIVCQGCHPQWDGMEAHCVWPCAEASRWLEILDAAGGQP